MKKEIEIERDKENIVRNSFWGFTSSIISRVGALVFTIILARFLMPEGYGLYSLVLSVAMIFYSFADLGINPALVRYVSLAIKKNKQEIPSYHRYLLKFKFFLTLTVSLLFLISSYPLAFYLFKDPQLFLPFLTASFYIFVLSFDTFYTQVFFSIEKVQYVTLRESLYNSMRISFALIVFYFIASSYHVVGIFFSFILISIFLILFSLFYTKRLFPEFYLEPKAKINKKKVIRFVWFLTIASISTAFFSHIDSVMLGLFVSLEYIGYYKAAFSLIIGIVGLLSFVNYVLLPAFTKLEKKSSNKLFTSAFRYVSIITIPSIFGLFVLGKYFIRIFFGYSYLPSLIPFYFLIPLIFPISLIGIFLALFSAEEKPEVFAKLILITSLINVSLNFIFIKLFLLISPLWATAGAAVATLISWTIYFIFSIYAIKKEFKFMIPFNLVVKPIISSLIMFIVLIYSLSFIENMTFFLGIGEVLLGIITYLLILILIKGVSERDLKLLKILIRR